MDPAIKNLLSTTSYRVTIDVKVDGSATMNVDAFGSDGVPAIALAKMLSSFVTKLLEETQIEIIRPGEDSTVTGEAAESEAKPPQGTEGNIEK